MQPILYSFRRCPYAIRARMVLRYASIQYELREVKLKDKPDAMRLASTKATVPTMVLADNQVLDESIDIIDWALQRNDPNNWLGTRHDEVAKALLYENDFEFKQHLDHYKYSERFPEHPTLFYRQHACEFIIKLEARLKVTKYLLGNQMSMVDIAIFPFIRQFAFVDKVWFDSTPYPALHKWLQQQLDSELFKAVMSKYSAWQDGDDAVIIAA